MSGRACETTHAIVSSRRDKAGPRPSPRCSGDVVRHLDSVVRAQSPRRRGTRPSAKRLRDDRAVASRITKLLSGCGWSTSRTSTVNPATGALSHWAVKVAKRAVMSRTRAETFDYCARGVPQPSPRRPGWRSAHHNLRRHADIGCTPSSSRLATVAEAADRLMLDPDALMRQPRADNVGRVSHTQCRAEASPRRSQGVPARKCSI
jgi:hypothetical protein